MRDIDSKIKLICKYCRKEFEVRPCENYRKFCTQKCYGKWMKGRKGILGANYRGGKKKKECFICGKKHTNSVCCSKSCYYKLRKINSFYRRKSVLKVNLICKQCSKEFKIIPSRKDTAKYCSMKCHGEHMSILRKGKKKGKMSKVWEKRRCLICNNVFSCYKKSNQKYCSNVCSQFSKRKEKELIICKNCHKEFLVHPCNINVRIFCCKKCYTEWSTWKVYGLKELITNLDEYQDWRQAVLSRDKHTCQECFNNNHLHVHHIKHFSQIIFKFLQEYNQFSPIEDKETLVRLAIKYKSFWDINNGITLCRDCHVNIHPFMNFRGAYAKRK